MSNSIEEQVSKLNPEALTADGYDRSMKGIAYRDGRAVVLYSSDKCIEQLMEDQDWSHEDAIDWFCYNTEYTYVGENTPIFEWEDIE